MKPRRTRPSSRKRPALINSSVIAEPPAPYESTPAIARVFYSGSSQAVRLPKEFRVETEELQIFRRGGDIILREKPLKFSERLAKAPQLSSEDIPDQIPDTPPRPIERLR